MEREEPGTFRMLAKRSLDRVRTSKYTDKFVGGLEILGLKPIVSRIYWTIHERMPSETEYEVAGIVTRFETSGRYEETSLTHTLVNERDVLADLLENLRVNDIFYDIGANLGIYTCFAASKIDPHENGEVLAFEPAPKNVSRIERNLELNDLEAEIHPIALSDTSGTTHLSIPTEAIGEQRHSITQDSTDDTIEVQTKRADTLVSEGASRPTVVKIDVEGAEMAVLEGFAETLSESSCRLLYCETHTDSDQDLEASVRSKIESFGFEITDEFQCGSETVLKARR